MGKLKYILLLLSLLILPGCTAMFFVASDNNYIGLDEQAETEAEIYRKEKQGNFVKYIERDRTIINSKDSIK